MASIHNKISFASILEWHLHWFNCTLRDAKEAFLRPHHDGFRNIDTLEAVLQRVRAQYSSLTWEVPTMMGDDTYRTEIEAELLADVDRPGQRYVEYKDLIVQVREMIKAEMLRRHEAAVLNLTARTSL